MSASLGVVVSTAPWTLPLEACGGAGQACALCSPFNWKLGVLDAAALSYVSH